MNEITNNIWIGDEKDVQTNNLSEVGIDHVITVCQDRTEDNVGCKYSFYNMSDGPDNKYGGQYDLKIYKRAANNMYKSVQNDNCVLIHCHRGQSRSVSVTVGVIARMTGKTVDDALEYVKNKHSQADPNELLLNRAREYVKLYR